MRKAKQKISYTKTSVGFTAGTLFISLLRVTQFVGWVRVTDLVGDEMLFCGAVKF